MPVGGSAPADQARLGFWMAAALVVGNMIGSGIFMLPAALAPFGADNLPAWLLSGGGAVILALAFSELTRVVPGAGGPYAYTREAFGDLAGFTVAWGYWVSVWVGNAAIATGAVGYAGEFLPWMTATPWHTALSTLAFVWVFTAVNCAGVRAAGWVQGWTTLFKLTPILAAAALLFIRLPDVGPTAAGAPRFTLSGTAAAATLTLWAMLGLESATIPSDRIRDPMRNVPRATVWGTVFTILISAAACAAVLLLVPTARVAASNAPFAELMRGAWGPTAARLVSLFAAVSALGALNGWILLQGALPLAMARDRLFARSFARVSRRGTPVAALLQTSGLVTVLVLLNAHRSLVGLFTFLVLLSTTAALFAYLSSALALVRLRGRSRPDVPPGRPVVRAALGWLGALYSVGALLGAGKEPLLWGLVLLLASLPFFLALGRRRAA